MEYVYGVWLRIITSAMSLVIQNDCLRCSIVGRKGAV